MNISVFGLGYVGAVVCGCLTKLGHSVVGVDVRAAKVRLVNAGQSPIAEPGLAELLAEAQRSGRLRASEDTAEAVLATDLSMICVGTPSGPDGDLDLSFVQRVCEQIGAALRTKSTFHAVVMRSTVLPGSVEGTMVPALEAASGKVCGRDFGVAMNPEFLREATAIQDFFHPPKTVVGARPGDAAGDMTAAIYQGLEAPLIRTSVKTAEMVKYVDNVFHALKITFANEIGGVCKALGIDSHEVMDIFCQDRKLNISPAYLKPGFAFGGSCLPKDLRGLLGAARRLAVPLPVIAAIGVSNRGQVERAVEIVMASGARRIGLLGVAFKAGSDDLREAPVVALVEALLQHGCTVRLYDTVVKRSLDAGIGFYLEERLPHLIPLFTSDLEEIVAASEFLVIGQRTPAMRELMEKLPAGKRVLDLVRVPAADAKPPTGYEGLSW